MSKAPFLRRYVHERRFGWRLLWRFLPNVLGPFYRQELEPCDCRANDWVEGDNGAIRCHQCGGYTGEPGTSIRVVAVQPEVDRLAERRYESWLESLKDHES